MTKNAGILQLIDSCGRIGKNGTDSRPSRPHPGRKYIWGKVVIGPLEN
jgi:hypothetical protein